MLEVVLADDADHFRRGLAAVLASDDDIHVVGQASDGAGLLELVEQFAPDVAVVDLRMPGTDGITATRLIRALSPITRVLILTVSDDDDDLLTAILAGAHGYLLKDAAIEGVPEAIREIVRGGAPLSPAVAAAFLAEFSILLGYVPSSPGPELRPSERRVLRLLARGATTPEIADALQLPRVVIALQVRNLLEKVHLYSWVTQREGIDGPVERPPRFRST